jgi:hypothetical protein
MIRTTKNERLQRSIVCFFMFGVVSGRAAEDPVILHILHHGGVSGSLRGTKDSRAVPA